MTRRASGQNAAARVTVAGILWQLLPAAALTFLFAAVGVLHVTSRVLVVDAGYRLSRLEQEHRALTLTNDRLKLELATLRSPARLERLSREQLSMAPPAAGAVIPLAAPRAVAGRSPPAARGGP
jgi:cell division protein FtsL